MLGHVVKGRILFEQRNSVTSSSSSRRGRTKQGHEIVLKLLRLDIIEPGHVLDGRIERVLEIVRTRLDHILQLFVPVFEREARV